ncbi:hypothetical protein PIB30_060865 [Stylosanthes scabra]|uniref:PB1-like domain-containing protein n=1 Tax=Stylosanthes scabra TaxID=79078 RepID=A0ABU6YJJ5_9FABA|nr:hypothetical protein [Stylosanthes scabra]
MEAKPRVSDNGAATARQTKNRNGEGGAVKVKLSRLKMVYFDIALYHRGYFGYVDGVMRYVGGEKLTIEDNDSDFWSVFEAEEQIRRLGDDDVAALWYKDLAIENMSIGLRMFLNDRDALAMVKIAQ